MCLRAARHGSWRETGTWTAADRTWCKQPRRKNLPWPVGTGRRRSSSGHETHPQETTMRRIVVATFTSLDGVMQAPGGPHEHPTGGSPLGLATANRLFGPGAAPAGLKLVKSRSFPTGVIVANYRPDGAVKTGDFQLAEPTEAERARRRDLT